MNYIYDLDDTLIDNSDLPFHAFYRMTKDLVSGKIERSPLFSRKGLKRLKELYAHYHYLETRKYMKNGEIQVAIGVKDFLGESDGFNAGLTNAPFRSTKYKLKELGIDSYLQEVLTSRDNLRKPSPGGIEEIINRSGLREEEFIYVGDSMKDLVAGRRAGIRTILITDDMVKRFFAKEAYASFEEFAENH